jgi:HTH-type transcriptional regulator/antitoxin HipB
MDYLLQSPTQIATHLKSLRKAQGLTQAQLGALVGLDQTRIAKIERDPRLVSFGQLLKIFSVLGVQMLLRDLKARDKPRPSNDTADW